MDFKSCSPSKKGFNAVLIIVDCLKKQFILIFYYKITITKDLIKLFIANVYCYYKSLEIIILN